jgi:8-oxo-dGTP pyrophosphatase MutT (NUDIX family)
MSSRRASSKGSRGRAAPKQAEGTPSKDPAKGSASKQPAKGRGSKPAKRAGSNQQARASAAKKPSGRVPAGKPDRASAREYSAGGVVVRDEEVIAIVPTRRAADGSQVIALPKGHVDPGESPLEAAAREVREETGVVAEPVTELGEARYWYRRDGRTIGKRVTFYLFKYVEGDTADHDDEVEEAFWLKLADAQEQLTHAAEREMVGLALAYLQKDR